MPDDCLFCRIVARETPATILFEDDDLVAFRDIRPKYRVHLLLVPKTHLASLADLGEAHDAVIGKLLRVAADLARQEGIGESGFRLVVNAGRDAGQVVPHVHIHLLGGEMLRGL